MVWLAWLVEPPALVIATDASDGTFTMMVWLAWLVEPPALVIATDASDGTFTMMVCVVSNAGNSDAVEVLVPEIPESMGDVATAEIELALLWLFVLLTSERTVVLGDSL